MARLKDAYVKDDRSRSDEEIQLQKRDADSQAG